jgi:hypothetical protein
MAGTTLRMPRSRGALSGVLLILLGIWGAMVPLAGPYLHFAFTPDRPWVVTTGRVWLEFLPAAAAVIGGIVMLTSRLRPGAMTGAALAGISGAWFAFGSHLTRLLMHNPPVAGSPVGSYFTRTIEQLGFFTGLGVVIICVAAFALGRLSLVSARDLKLAERLAGTPGPAGAGPVGTAPAGTDPAGAKTAARTAPLATLTKIASRKKKGAATFDEEAAKSREQVSSGT